MPTASFREGMRLNSGCFAIVGLPKDQLLTRTNKITLESQFQQPLKSLSSTANVTMQTNMFQILLTQIHSIVVQEIK